MTTTLRLTWACSCITLIVNSFCGIGVAATDDLHNKDETPKSQIQHGINNQLQPIKHLIECNDGKAEFNFGYVGSKSKNRVTFRIANPLDEDLRIRRTRSECKCMKVANAKDIHVIKAGGTIDIIVDFEAPDEVTQYSKRIILQTYNTDMKYISLRVKADVDMPLAFQENVIDAGVLTGGQDVSLEACVLNRGDKDIRLAYATSNSPKCIAAIPREPVKAKGQMSVPVKFTTAELPGEYKAIVRVQTADEKQKSLTLTVKYKVADPSKKPLDTDKASSASSDHSN